MYTGGPGWDWGGGARAVLSQEAEQVLQKTAQRALGHNTYFWGVGICHWPLNSMSPLGSEHWAQSFCEIHNLCWLWPLSPASSPRTVCLGNCSAFFRTIFNVQAALVEPECLVKTSYVTSADLPGAKVSNRQADVGGA